MSFLRFVPERWQRQWRDRTTVRQVATGTVWLAADQLFRLGVSFVVGAWVARHLGTERFGLLNVAAAFCAPFAALVSLGINQLVVRDLIRAPEESASILGTAGGLKLGGGIVGLLLCLGAMLLSPEGHGEFRLLVPIIMLGTLFQTGEVLDLWFQAHRGLRESAVVRSAVSLTVNLGKVALILGDVPLVWFAVASVAEVVLCAGGWLALYRWRRASTAWRFAPERAGRMLREAWPLALAGIAIQVQAYSDQVILGWLGGPAETGTYAAALRLVLVFGFLPLALQTAAAPEIARAWAVDRPLYLRRLRDVYRVMLVASFALGGALALGAKPIVALVYGSGFSAAAGLLPLMALRILLSSVGVVRGTFITNEALFVHSLVTAVAGAALNVGLNLWWIPRWGALGCAAAAVVSFAGTTIGFDLLHRTARLNARVILSALGLCRLPA